MKRYTALRIIAGILKVIGWVILGFTAFVLLFALKNPMPVDPTIGAGMFYFGIFVVFGLFALIGIAFIAGGQLLSAIADIATNSHYLRLINESAGRTAHYFDVMANRANAQPQAPPQAART